MAARKAMIRVLVDTSVWVDYFNDNATPEVEKLEILLDQRDKICTCGVILTEVLQGFRNDHDYDRALFRFEPFVFLPMERGTFVKAANLYRRLRSKGVTIRNRIDCMIAAVAIEHDTSLLHKDRDFDLIARHSSLKIIKD